jgi:murein DD-endopeptidase MepM/ murein hydrolase activator NlpD
MRTILGKTVAAACAAALVATATAGAAPLRGPAGPVSAFSALSETGSRVAWVELVARREHPAGAAVFPVPGAHDYGTEENRFGGGRGHRGQDVLARCGTPVLAALGGRVSDVKWEAAAGNYAVVRAANGTSQVYMHLRDAASVHAGERIEAGAAIGRVGRTGDASTCHLHFEQWTAPGWYAGGRAVDPLPALRRWDAVPG